MVSHLEGVRGCSSRAVVQCQQCHRRRRANDHVLLDGVGNLQLDELLQHGAHGPLQQVLRVVRLTRQKAERRHLHVEHRVDRRQLPHAQRLLDHRQHLHAMQPKCSLSSFNRMRC
jgi:hypothetical protein